MPADPTRDLERADERSGERTRDADDVGMHFVHRLLEMTFERTVDDAAATDLPLELAEVLDGHTKMFGIPREAEVGVDLVADVPREVVDDL